MSRAARSRTSARLAYQTRQVTGPSSTMKQQAVEESNPAREDLETKLCPAPDLHVALDVIRPSRKLRSFRLCRMDPTGFAPAPSCLQGRRSPTRATSPGSAEAEWTQRRRRERGDSGLAPIPLYH